MKIDYTLTGKRTRKGKMEDGWKGIKRYYINNFEDVYNQNRIGLVVGEIGWEDMHGVNRVQPYHEIWIITAVHSSY